MHAHTQGILSTIWLFAHHNGLDLNGRSAIQTVITLLDDILLPLHLFAVDFSLDASLGLAQDSQFRRVVGQLGFASQRIHHRFLGAQLIDLSTQHLDCLRQTEIPRGGFLDLICWILVLRFRGLFIFILDKLFLVWK